ncbi:transporter, AcrB/AcrD/AcrF family protein [Fictibacillus macauensis ZFHKF-1]|uniref:Transporter, AcrB/AcrD/AcrF family protein n=1 Tax=Fictibacillus macauensis ZFHKF-1 TaxID=1196324 RepID=I8AMZ3_9BACL|nr:efflux RND transporter permease subunit [Fictibacillus macauensis]EIT87079.1 transporter, AcrB/AcrD/AcrF family protein [Fictibacillus macauensis ZFHKF-1]
MSGIIRFCLKNKFAVWLLTILVVFSGLYAGLNMKLETLPNINTPIVSVSAAYPGATPQEVADSVTIPLENKVKNLAGVKSVRSSSFQNVASLQIEYNFSKDMEKAKDEVKEALADIELPKDVKTPKVTRQTLNDFPILSLSVSNSKQSLQALSKTVEDDLIPSLEEVDGVAAVQAAGQSADEVQLSFKKTALQRYNLTEQKVKDYVKASSSSVPLGLYSIDKKEKSIVIDGNKKTLQALRDLKIPYTPTQQQQAATPAPSSAPPAAQAAVTVPTVALKEVADLKVVGITKSIAHTNGRQSIGLQITKASDANTVNVADAVTKKLTQLKKEHDGLKTVTVFDQATPIKDSVSTMVNKALIGGVFAVLIILLFLRNFRSTIIAVISIPLSLLIAILVLKQMDISLNIMTLGAMTVAIGRVVDDSIVVIENIYRRMALRGESLKGKALITAATHEMFIPIMSSTIVTIAVFLPLGFVSGPVGELFLPFALTIVFALVASLIVAITLVPAFAHSLFKKGLKEKHVTQPQGEAKRGAFTRSYRRLLNWSLQHKLLSFGFAIVLLVASLFLVPLIGVSFLPNDNQKMVIATYSPEPGQTRKDIEQQASKAERMLLDRKHVQTIQYSVGSENPMNPGNSNQALFFLKYDSDTPNFENEQKRVIDALKKTTSKGAWKTQDFGATGGSSKLEIQVYGNKKSEIEPVAKDIERIMKRNHSLRNVDSSLSKAYDEYTLQMNQKKLSDLGLSAGQIGMEFAGGGDDGALTTIKKNGKDIDVVVKRKKKAYDDIADFTKEKVQTPTGQSISLDQVATVKKGKTANTITRKDDKIYASVSGDVIGKDVSAVSSALQKKVDALHVKSGTSVKMGGVTEDINDSFSQLGLAMLAAICIVYFVLVVTFGGALAPFAILFSLPFTVIGGLVALYIADESLSISAMIGALMLIGIVVTNAIVLVDRVIHKENEGYTTREALLEAGTVRLRPILMTALATIGALIPLALGYEGGGLISKGLGVTVIGGLTSSTLLTLIIVPVVYEFLSRWRRKKIEE